MQTQTVATRVKKLEEQLYDCFASARLFSKDTIMSADARS